MDNMLWKKTYASYIMEDGLFIQFQMLDACKMTVATVISWKMTNVTWTDDDDSVIRKIGWMEDNQ